MKTTLNVDESVMRRLKQEAARRGQTMSELVEAALRRYFAEAAETRELPQLPRFASGGARVDVADRDELERAMGGR